MWLRFIVITIIYLRAALFVAPSDHTTQHQMKTDKWILINKHCESKSFDGSPSFGNYRIQRILHNLFRGNQQYFSHSFDSLCRNKGKVVVCSQIHQLGKDAGVEATIGRRKLNHFFLGATLRIKMANIVMALRAALLEYKNFSMPFCGFSTFQAIFISI